LLQFVVYWQTREYLVNWSYMQVAKWDLEDKFCLRTLFRTLSSVFNLIFCIYLGLRNSSIKAHHVRIPGISLFLKVVCCCSLSSRFVWHYTHLVNDYCSWWLLWSEDGLLKDKCRGPTEYLIVLLRYPNDPALLTLGTFETVVAKRGSNTLLTLKWLIRSCLTFSKFISGILLYLCRPFLMLHMTDVFKVPLLSLPLSHTRYHAHPKNIQTSQVSLLPP
jgi:hypothetical protein